VSDGTDAERTDGDAGDGTATANECRNERDAVSRVRWALRNPDEGRLRMPWRILVAAVLLAIVLVVSGLATSLLPAPESVADPVGRALYGTVLFVAVNAVVVGTVLAVARRVDHRAIADLGLGLDGRWWADAAFGAALGIVLPSLIVAVELAAGWAVVDGVLVAGGGLFPFVTGAPVLVGVLSVFGLFVAVAVVEEVLVRGYLLTNVAEGFDGWWRFDASAAIAVAVLATSGLFGVLHATNPNATVFSLLTISLYGILLGLGYVLTGRLGLPVGVHLTWNFTIGAVYGLPVSGVETGATLVAVGTTGPERFTGGAFGPEGGLLAVAALPLGIALLAGWVWWHDGGLALDERVAVPELLASDGQAE